MARVRSRSATLLRIVAVCGIASVVAVACATGSERVEQSEDDNLTETTAATGGSGGMGGSLVTAATTTSSTGGSGGTGGEDLTCTEDPCKVTEPQCGCPTGEKCTLLPGLYTRACRDAGTAVHAETCADDLDCAPGTYCMNLAGHRVCRDYCEADTDCETPGGLCRVELGLNPGDEKWCSDNCDPISNAGCAIAGSKCIPVLDPTDTWYTLCVAAGGSGQGQACSQHTDCGPGQGCLAPTGQAAACRDYCDINAPSCATGTCTPFEDPKPVFGPIEYGGCL